MLFDYPYVNQPMMIVIGSRAKRHGDASDTPDTSQSRWVAGATVDSRRAAHYCRRWALQYPELSFEILQPPVLGYPFCILENPIAPEKLSFLQLFANQELVEPRSEVSEPAGISIVVEDEFFAPLGIEPGRTPKISRHSPLEFERLREWSGLWENYFRAWKAHDTRRPRLRVIPRAE